MLTIMARRMRISQLNPTEISSQEPFKGHVSIIINIERLESDIKVSHFSISMQFMCTFDYNLEMSTLSQ